MFVVWEENMKYMAYYVLELSRNGYRFLSWGLISHLLLCGSCAAGFTQKYAVIGVPQIELQQHILVMNENAF